MVQNRVGQIHATGVTEPAQRRINHNGPSECRITPCGVQSFGPLHGVRESVCILMYC